jgi:adenine deaminase
VKTLHGSTEEERALLMALVDVAQGALPADLIIKGGRLVNVLTGEIYAADVAVKGHRIAAVGDVEYTAGARTQRFDASGSFLVPGMIDQHVHVHESQLNIVEFAAATVPRGTAGIATDFYGETVVRGVDAVHACLQEVEALPLKVWFMAGIPAYYQNAPFGHSGWPSHSEMLELIRRPDCFGLSDTSGSRVAGKDLSQLELIDATQALFKKVTGHGAALDERAATAWMAYSRDTDDHECVAAEEAVRKARLGIRIVVREGAGCYDLDELARAITEHHLDPRRFCFCTDVPSALRLTELGHLDHIVRKAIQRGIEPITAIQMATINTAECLHIDRDHGSIAPGKWADIALVDSLEDFEVRAFIANGVYVAEDGRLLARPTPPRFPTWAYDTVILPREITATDFAIPASTKGEAVTARVIRASGTSILSEEELVELEPEVGMLVADVSRDILKIAAIERVRGTGEIGVGLVKGFGLKRGALGTTFNSQAENIILVGVSDEDLALAANALREAGGGFIVVEDGSVRALLPLPLFGLESERRYDEVAEQLRLVQAAAAELGCQMPDAFATLGFTGTPVEIGTLKIAPEGVVDTILGATVPVEVAG